MEDAKDWSHTTDSCTIAIFKKEIPTTKLWLAVNYKYTQVSKVKEKTVYLRIDEIRYKLWTLMNLV